MSIYNVLTEDHHQPHPQTGHKVQRYFSGTTPSAGYGYPDLHLEIAIKTDSKTKLINPANAWTGDVKIMIAPFGTGLSEAFHAPTIGLHKEIRGPLLSFNFYYTVSLIGTTKVHLGFKDIISIDKDITPSKGLVFVNGTLNTVTGETQFTSVKRSNNSPLQER